MRKKKHWRDKKKTELKNSVTPLKKLTRKSCKGCKGKVENLDRISKGYENYFKNHREGRCGKCGTQWKKLIFQIIGIKEEPEINGIEQLFNKIIGKKTSQNEGKTYP